MCDQQVVEDRVSNIFNGCSLFCGSGALSWRGDSLPLSFLPTSSIVVGVASFCLARRFRSRGRYFVPGALQRRTGRGAALFSSCGFVSSSLLSGQALTGPHRRRRVH